MISDDMHFQKPFEFIDDVDDEFFDQFIHNDHHFIAFVFEKNYNTIINEKKNDDFVTNNYAWLLKNFNEF